MELYYIILNQINKLLGLRYWYYVRYNYKDDQGKILFDYTTSVGVRDKRTILNHREIKKIVKPVYYVLGKSSKYLLCNGVVECEIMCYLGKTKMK